MGASYGVALGGIECVVASPPTPTLTPPRLAQTTPPGSHEFGHWWAARKHGLELGLPFFIPAGFGFLGSFGSITRVK